jgi:hypothetical protein
MTNDYRLKTRKEVKDMTDTTVLIASFVAFAGLMIAWVILPVSGLDSNKRSALD